ncbi:MAG: hypothetical protein A2007_00320 [Verrucomicrobia bacterium GWC2_42_7]|nr:MAG: hypothetical protein A2007_00320 [Verrucomicrobia bacterium GWC2_42_7]
MQVFFHKIIYISLWGNRFWSQKSFSLHPFLKGGNLWSNKLLKNLLDHKRSSTKHLLNTPSFFAKIGFLEKRFLGNKDK